MSEPTTPTGDQPAPPGARLEEVFDAERDRLIGLAYRMLGSIADAEDVVQTAWLRWSDPGRGPVDRPAAWLTTVVSRLAIDRMRQQQRRREDYVGPWLPEPVATQAADPGSVGVDPARAAELADSVTFGFRAASDRPARSKPCSSCSTCSASRSPDRRGGGRSPGVRQIASRARRKVRRPPGRPATADEALLKSSSSLARGRSTRCCRMSPDVVLTSGRPGGRRTPTVVGPDRVSRLMVHLTPGSSTTSVSLTERTVPPPRHPRAGSAHGARRGCRARRPDRRGAHRDEPREARRDRPPRTGPLTRRSRTRRPCVLSRSPVTGAAELRDGTGWQHRIGWQRRRARQLST